MAENAKVLITVMTYPHPSRGHQELVCTAGITEEGEWIRLYPIDYRYQPRDRQFKKYQSIEVELEDEGHGNDNRRESRKPNLDTLQVIGEPLDTKNLSQNLSERVPRPGNSVAETSFGIGSKKNWEKRRAYIDPLPHRTLNELKALFDEDKTSLAWIPIPPCEPKVS